MQDNRHLTVREQFYARMAYKILHNLDNAYTFMGIVCDTVSITDLVTIETVYANKTKERTQGVN